jgi:Rhodanese-like domain
LVRRSLELVRKRALLALGSVAEVIEVLADPPREAREPVPLRLERRLGLGRLEACGLLRGGLVEIRGVDPGEGAGRLPGRGVLGQQSSLGGERADGIGLLGEGASAELAAAAPRAGQNDGENRRCLYAPVAFPYANSTFFPSRRAAETSSRRARSKPKMRSIRRNEVRQLLKQGAQLVEVLPHDDYEEEHIAGAINIPLKELNRQTAMQLDRSRPVIVYCEDYQ